MRDAAELDERSRISRRLPRPNGAHIYTLRDPALRRSGAGLLLTRHATRLAGDLQLSHVADRFGTEVGIGGPGIDYHCFGLVQAGGMALSVPGSRDEVVARGSQGLIHAGRDGTHALTADGTVRTNLWGATARRAAGRAAWHGDAPRAPLVFAPTLDWSRGCGPALRRLLLHVAEELARSDGIASSPLALEAFTDLFVHTALRGLPHNYSERLARGGEMPVPGYVHRAEEYMRAHAADPLRMEQVAAASGCSVRALQLAFRRFRDTTPLAALTKVRLARARQELSCDDALVAAVARRWGFSNTGRFASAYFRRFGETPAATRRRHCAEG